MTRSSAPVFLAAYSSAPYLALAVVTEGEIIEVRQHRFTATERERAKRLLALLAAEYAVSALVLPPESWLSKLAAELPWPSLPLTVTAAKAYLIPNIVRRTHPELYQQLIEAYPELRRFVTILPHTGRVAASEAWRTVALLAVALALSAAGAFASAPATVRSDPSLTF